MWIPRASLLEGTCRSMSECFMEDRDAHDPLTGWAQYMHTCSASSAPLPGRSAELFHAWKILEGVFWATPQKGRLARPRRLTAKFYVQEGG